ncbi:hypothetical protein ACLKA6_014990 [Drosophila palustris]
MLRMHQEAARLGNLYRHVTTHHPDLKYKIKLKKIEQQCIRKEQRNEKKKQAKTQKYREKKKKEKFKFIEEKKALKKVANPTTPRSFWPKA